ncbi:Uu.00g142260.m01.CDS01 [Anthostomella pinea]|uniref:Uu.00g142260.m01.CDS01 n=1 Tax=Anthostomella pinea TaxID=933095 RepID=A0AAI8YLP3_9PEZI|nr:Uu.00g142260.m01.CDS01 [Anthostomella pinea]
MLSIWTIIRTALTILIATTLPRAHANGCYHSGLTFTELQGGSPPYDKQSTYDTHDDQVKEDVLTDINKTCHLASAANPISGAKPFKLCTTWNKTISDNLGCYEMCTSDCKAPSWGRAGDFGASLCGLGCDKNCEKPPEGNNHLDYEIKPGDNSSDDEGNSKDLDEQKCITALYTEVHGCQSGSEQKHDGFWFKLDPNTGDCG